MRTKIEPPAVCPLCTALTQPHKTCGNPPCDWVVCSNTACAAIIDSYGRVSRRVGPR